MPNTITNRQMFFILLLTLTSFSAVYIPKAMALYAGTMNWLTLIAAAAIFALLALLWSVLNNRFKGKMLFDYSGEILGKAGAMALALFFILYFLSVLVQLDLSMSELLKANFLPRTPGWFTILASLPVIGYVAHKGVTNSARVIEIYGVIFILVALTVHLIMLLQGEIKNIEPLFDPAETGNALSAVKETIYPFLGIEVLSVIPFTEKNGRKANITAVVSLLFIGLFFILVTESSIMMIGMNEITHYNFPLVMAIRQVELPTLKLLQRLDIVYLTVGFLGLLGGLIVVYLSVVEFACRMLPKVNRLFVVTGVGLLTFVICAAGQNIKDFIQTLIRFITIAGLLAAGLVPLALLMTAKLRKLGEAKK